MIGPPINDEACLGAITDLIRERVIACDPALMDLAKRYATTAALAAWIRSLPQRDDTGDPADGPKVDGCDPPQRLWVPSEKPNCVERASMMLGAAEYIDPEPVRQLATITTPVGRHTFLVEDGDPVILDPELPRNALEAGLFRMDERPVTMSPRQQVEWIAGIAEEPAAGFRHGVRRVRNGCSALCKAIAGTPIAPRQVPDVVFTLALAEREAHLFGARGVAVHRALMASLDAAALAHAVRNGHRNRVELRVGRTRVRPVDVGTLGSVARVVGRVGARIGAVAAQSALNRIGVTPELLTEVEHELNREGLSLGPLARADEDRRTYGPIAGSLTAVAKGGLS